MIQRIIKSNGWLVTAVLAGIALGYVFLFFLPGQKKIVKANEELSDIRQLIMDANRLAPAIVRMKKKHEKAAVFTSSWRSTSIEQNQLAVLLGSISHQCEMAGAEIVRMAPQAPKKHDTIQEIPLAVTIEGTYQQMFEFLHRIENLPGKVLTDGIQIRSTGENGSLMRCEVELKIFTGNPDKTG